MARAAKLPAGLTEEDRQWIDWRFEWLCSEFGFDFLRDAQVVGLDDDALLLVSGERGQRESSTGKSKLEQRAEVYFDRVSELMGLDASTVELTFSNSFSTSQATQRSKTEALYEIVLAKAELQDRNRLIALLAHEIAYIHLVRHDRVDEEAKDDEPLSDLACIFFGLGAFTANAAPSRANPIRTGEFTCSLSPEMCGYAFACFAYLRGEGTTTWESQLRDDVRRSFDDARDYIDAQGTSNIETYSLADANRYVASSQSSIQPIRQTAEPNYQSEGGRKDEREEERKHERDSTDYRESEYDETEGESYRDRETQEFLSSASEASKSQQLHDSQPDPNSDYRIAAVPLVKHASSSASDSLLYDNRASNQNAPSSHCPECGSRKPQGADYCRDCEAEYQVRMERLRAELASHDESVWGMNFAALVMIALVILAAVAALNFSG